MGLFRFVTPQAKRWITFGVKFVIWAGWTGFLKRLFQSDHFYAIFEVVVVFWFFVSSFPGCFFIVNDWRFVKKLPEGYLITWFVVVEDVVYSLSVDDSEFKTVCFFGWSFEDINTVDLCFFICKSEIRLFQVFIFFLSFFWIFVCLPFSLVFYVKESNKLHIPRQDLSLLDLR